MKIALTLSAVILTASSITYGANIVQRDINIKYESLPYVLPMDSSLSENMQILETKYFVDDLKKIKQAASGYVRPGSQKSFSIGIIKTDMERLSLSGSHSGYRPLTDDQIQEIKVKVGCDDKLLLESGFETSCTKLIKKMNPAHIQGPIRKEVTVPYLKLTAELSIRSNKHWSEVDNDYPCSSSEDVKVQRELYIYPLTLKTLQENSGDDFRFDYKRPNISDAMLVNQCENFKQVLFIE
jgi:hypothetical protein